MIINFTIWSPLISLAAMVLLHPLRSHSRGNQTARNLALILALPALISSIYILKLTALDQATISKISQLPMIPIYFGARISTLNATINTCIISSVITFIFFLPKKQFVENISAAAMSFGILFIVSVSPDQLIKFSAFSIGTILITYMFLNDEHDHDIITHITGDFLLHRTSDFLALLALICTLINHHTLLTTGLANFNGSMEAFLRIALFLAIALRTISLPMVTTDLSRRTASAIRYSLIRRVLIGAGSQLLLLPFAGAIARYDLLHNIFTCCAVFILLLYIIFILFDNDKTKWADHLADILSALALVSTCFGYINISVITICGIIFIYPIIALPGYLKSMSILYIAHPPEFSRSANWASYSNWIFFRLPINLAKFFGSLFINFLNPLYAGFLLYRLPQLMISILEWPLRLLHNGNVQRSLIFVVIVLSSYAYWWGQR